MLAVLRGGGRRNPMVAARLHELGESNLCTSVLVIGETRHGIELIRRRDADAAAALERWLIEDILNGFEDRILPVTRGIAERWGRLGVPDPVPAIDGLLAATALEHDLTLVTRNVAHVRRAGAQILNPFEAE